MVFLAFAFRGSKGERIIALHSTWPLISIRTEWYGILGLIGWAYLVACLIYLIFRNNRAALLGCMILLLCLFIADRKGAFDDFPLANIVSIGETLGSQASITLAGMIIATLLLTPDTQDHSQRLRFAILFALGCAAAALLVHRLYGISKNNATPSWCLWAALTSDMTIIYGTSLAAVSLIAVFRFFPPPQPGMSWESALWAKPRWEKTACWIISSMWSMA